MIIIIIIIIDISLQFFFFFCLTLRQALTLPRNPRTLESHCPCHCRSREVETPVTYKAPLRETKRGGLTAPERRKGLCLHTAEAPGSLELSQKRNWGNSFMSTHCVLDALGGFKLQPSTYATQHPTRGPRSLTAPLGYTARGPTAPRRRTSPPNSLTNPSHSCRVHAIPTKEEFALLCPSFTRLGRDAKLSLRHLFKGRVRARQQGY